MAGRNGSVPLFSVFHARQEDGAKRICNHTKRQNDRILLHTQFFWLQESWIIHGKDLKQAAPNENRLKATASLSSHSLFSRLCPSRYHFNSLGPMEEEEIPKPPIIIPKHLFHKN